jgi:23S rRNA (adenine-N6)-dimethyltransferase
VGGRSRSARTGARPTGRHLLRSRILATEIVVAAGIGPDDHVVEIGAGTGRLTEVLALHAARVTAIELDPRFAESLRRRFVDRTTIDVVEADALRVNLPSTPFRAFGNVPFGITTPILRRMLDAPGSRVHACDVLVQFEFARKRAQAWPSTALSIGWLPWWELTLVRRITREAFEPPPTVDAGVLSVRRRSPPLLAHRDRADFVALVGRAFGRGSWPVRRSLRDELSPLTWKRLARERGLPIEAPARDLDVFDWVALFRAAHR